MLFRLLFRFAVLIKLIFRGFACGFNGRFRLSPRGVAGPGYSVYAFTFLQLLFLLVAIRERSKPNLGILLDEVPAASLVTLSLTLLQVGY